MDNKKKILIIDDEKELVQSIMVRLKASGYDVITAADGKLGVDTVRAEKPDLVLLDVIMPNLDGIETLQQIKQISRETIVIMITAFGSMKTALECMQLGGYDYIAKPFENKTLLSKIEKALSENKR
ncbi:MAG: hypothetical protein AUJ75_04590 [Candidatus Omnitrophica bacterium CG1_02_49_10]|nr:MAG: hypothetical protein AUJ75_04590 [Candidatus Omnitrophica bacterium CG1_02_49_10]